MAKLLSSLGIPCGHESIFSLDENPQLKLKGRSQINLSQTSLMNHRNRESLTPWVDVDTLVADSSYLAAPYLKDYPEATIIHVVRSPLMVINSYLDHTLGGMGYFTTLNDPYEIYICKHLEEIRSIISPTHRACYFYLEWNRMIEKQCEGRKFYFHRIEDDINNLCKFLNVENKNPFSDRKANTFRFHKDNFKSWDDVPKGTIKNDLIDMAERYGYDQLSVG